MPTVPGQLRKVHQEQERGLQTAHPMPEREQLQRPTAPELRTIHPWLGLQPELQTTHRRPEREQLQSLQRPMAPAPERIQTDLRELEPVPQILRELAPVLQTTHQEQEPLQVPQIGHREPETGPLQRPVPPELPWGLTWLHQN